MLQDHEVIKTIRDGNLYPYLYTHTDESEVDELIEIILCYERAISTPNLALVRQEVADDLRILWGE